MSNEMAIVEFPWIDLSFERHQLSGGQRRFLSRNYAVQQHASGPSGSALVGTPWGAGLGENSSVVVPLR